MESLTCLYVWLHVCIWITGCSLHGSIWIAILSLTWIWLHLLQICNTHMDLVFSLLGPHMGSTSLYVITQMAPWLHIICQHGFWMECLHIITHMDLAPCSHIITHMAPCLHIITHMDPCLHNITHMDLDPCSHIISYISLIKSLW